MFRLSSSTTKLTALIGLSVALMVTSACMGGKKMTEEERKEACKDVVVDCTGVTPEHPYFPASFDEQRPQQPQLCIHKCLEIPPGIVKTCPRGKRCIWVKDRSECRLDEYCVIGSPPTETSTSTDVACTMQVRICKDGKPGTSIPGTCNYSCPEDPPAVVGLPPATSDSRTGTSTNTSTN